MEVEALLVALAQSRGYDFREYHRGPLSRRIRAAVLEEGVSSISMLQELVLRDREAMERLIATISVHVSSMFRDPEFYKAFRVYAVPILRTYPFIRIWHAGCATGEEVYSMAILMADEGLYHRCRIYATDMSSRVLERGQKGIYSLQVMREGSANYELSGGPGQLQRHCVADSQQVMFRDNLRRNLVFAQHNLTCDGVFNDFHVVLCRNVMMYFTAPLRDRVQRLLHESSMRLGLLGLGRKESLAHGPLESLYREVAGVRLYRRVA